MKAKYLKDAPKEVKLVTVSARVPEELYQQFQKAAVKAKEIGKELSITPVVLAAIEDAVNELLQASNMSKEQLNAVTLPVHEDNVKAQSKARGKTGSRRKPKPADQLPLTGVTN